MNRPRFDAIVLPVLAAFAAAACATSFEVSIGPPAANSMSAETAQRVVRAALSRSYPVTAFGAKFTVIELTSRQFRVVLGEKECIFKFGANVPLNVFNRESSYYVRLFEKGCGIHWQTFDEAKPFSDGLSRLETLAMAGRLNVQKNEAVDFKKVAVEYRARNSKPILPEEARKYKVLAENAFDEKRYGEALDHFESALQIAPWWAQGHYNRALLLARDNNFEDAVAEMKIYLDLAPDAKDALAARDKIYIWEAKVGKTGGSAHPIAEAAGLPPTTHGDGAGAGASGN